MTTRDDIVDQITPKKISSQPASDLGAESPAGPQHPDLVKSLKRHTRHESGRDVEIGTGDRRSTVGHLILISSIFHDSMHSRRSS